MVVTGRVGGFIGRGIIGDDRQPGEEVLGFASEPGNTGDTWVITTLAVYICAKNSRSNRRRGHQREFRIPRSEVTEVRQVPIEANTALTIAVLHKGVALDFTGVFRTHKAAGLARMISPTSEVR